MDAFVFVREASQGIVRDLMGLVPDESSPVRFVTTLSGRYDALVVMEVQGVLQLQDYVLGTIHGDRQLSTDTAIELIPGPLRIKRGTPTAIEAFVRIRVDAGASGQVLDALSALPGYLGSAIVAADFDILLELGAGTMDQVVAALMQMQTIKGIRSSASSFAAFAAGGGT